MEGKKTMTLILSDQEMDVLGELSSKKRLSKTGLLRQALRLYQSIDVRLEKGEKLYVEDPISKEKSELLIL